MNIEIKIKKEKSVMNKSVFVKVFLIFVLIMSSINNCINASLEIEIKNLASNVGRFRELINSIEQPEKRGKFQEYLNATIELLNCYIEVYPSFRASLDELIKKYFELACKKSQELSFDIVTHEEAMIKNGDYIKGALLRLHKLELKYKIKFDKEFELETAEKFEAALRKDFIYACSGAPGTHKIDALAKLRAFLSIKKRAHVELPAGSASPSVAAPAPAVVEGSAAPAPVLAPAPVVSTSKGHQVLPSVDSAARSSEVVSPRTAHPDSDSGKEEESEDSDTSSVVTTKHYLQN